MDARAWKAVSAVVWFCAWAAGADVAAQGEEDGLVAHYALNEGSGATVRDSKAAQARGEIRAATWVRRDGRTGLRFDGKSARVDCGTTARLGLKDEISVSAWVLPESSDVKKDAVIVGFDPDTWALTRYKDCVYFYVSGGGNYLKTPVPPHQWTHVVGTFDGKMMRLYVNGALGGSRKPKTPIKVTAGERFFIGGGSKIRGRYQGLVSDVRIYNRALSGPEVDTLALPPDSELPRMKLSETEKKAGTTFFQRARRDVEFRRSGRQLWLANDKVGFEILQGERGFYLSRIHGPGPGQDFLVERSAALRGGFWRLALRRDRGRDEAGKTVSSTSGAEVTSDVERSADAVTLKLLWKALAVASEEGALDVEVLLTVRQGDPFAQWRINVTNRSRTWGLWNVVFPILKLRPLGDDPSSNRFTVPRTQGIVGRDPFRTPFFTPGKYPGTTNMQFSVLYDQSGNGLYLAMHDGAGYAKHFHNEPLIGLDVLEYRVDHFPANMGYPAEDFEMAYDFVIGPFDGDWYDGCQIYRAWAAKQQWCRKGPLASRRDVPRWYKESPMGLIINSSGGDKDVAELRDRMLAFLAFTGTDLPVVWYTWKQHFPDRTHYNKEGSPWKVPDKRPRPCGNIHDGNYPALPALKTFAPACKAIGEAGGHVSPYVCSRIYDQGLNENAPLAAEAKPNTIRKLDGNIRYVEQGDVAWGMCYHTKWWQRRMKETVTELIRRENARGIYFDTFYGGRIQCFDVRHGHSHGGGNHGYVGARQLSEVVRGAMKEADPESVMSGENPAETAIDLLDGFLYSDTIRPDGLPLFATVYGDYISRVGRYISVQRDGFTMQCATLFLEGAQLGRMYVSQAEFLKKEHTGTEEGKRMLFLRKLTRYYRADTGAKYLAYGQLLRPITFAKPDPMPTSSCKETYRFTWILTRPSLMSGTFRAPNGDIGVFIINISRKPLRFSFELTPESYPIRKTETYRVLSVNADGDRRQVGESQKGSIRYSGEAHAHDLVCIEIRPLD